MKQITKKEFINALSTKKNFLGYCNRQLHKTVEEILNLISQNDTELVIYNNTENFRTVKKVRSNSIKFSDGSNYRVESGHEFYYVNGYFVDIEKVKNFEGKEVINLLGYILID